MTNLVVYKYPLPICDGVIELREGAQVLRVGSDPMGTLCVWALVDTSRPARRVVVWMQPTGKPLPVEKCFHLGSFVTDQLVIHVFSDTDVRAR